MLSAFPLWQMSENLETNPRSQDFWSRYWREWAEDPAALVRDRESTARYLKENQSLGDRESRCLDIGGGGGGVAYHLLRSNPRLRLVVADLSVDLARKTLADLGAGRLELVEQDVRQPWDSRIASAAPFDRAWICELDYLFSDEQWRRILRRSADLLSPDGRLSVTTSAVLNYANLAIAGARTAIDWARSGARRRPFAYGVARSIERHRSLIERALPELRIIDERAIKPRSRRWGIRFGESDCEQYGFTLGR